MAEDTSSVPSFPALRWGHHRAPLNHEWVGGEEIDAWVAGNGEGLGWMAVESMDRWDVWMCACMSA